jgi:hypothetical protein
MSTVVTIWAVACLVAAVTLVISARWIGRSRVAAWLVVLGVFVLMGEEPAITFWLAVSGPDVDPDGMAGLITPMARAHAFDSGLFGIAAAVLLCWVALTAFKRGEHWARRVLGWAFAVVTVTLATSAWLVFSRGLALAGPGGAAGQAGFGWQPVIVGLLAWASGLWLGRQAQPQLSPARAQSASVQR